MQIIKTLTKMLTGAALAGALLLATPHKAEAQRFGIGVSVGGPIVAGPVYGAYYGPTPYYAYGPGYYPYAYGYPPVYGGYGGGGYYGRGYGYGRGYAYNRGGYGYGRGGYGYNRGGYGGGYARGGRR